MVKNTSYIVAQYTEDETPVPGKHIVLKDLETDIENAPEGGIITKNLYISLDPYISGRMVKPADPTAFSWNLPIGEAILNGGVGEVIASNSDKFQVGDLVYAGIDNVGLGLQQYTRLNSDDTKLVRKVSNPYNLPLSHWTGILGLSGLTAYSSLYEIGRPKAGETIFVTSASGAVGQIVGQIAKREGLRVIGSVGSDSKVEYITRVLGFDGAFNYKTEAPADALKRLAPEGIDIYYDNVGGVQLDAAIDAAKPYARFIECGMMSYYNIPEEQHYVPRNLMRIVAKRLTIRGFFATDPDLGPKYEKRFYEEVPRWIRDGEIKVREDVTEGVENAGEAFVGMLKGKNEGKALVKVVW